VELGRREDGQDVLEEDARRGEVGELAEGAVEAYLKTGEFGGGGGIGGGESSFTDRRGGSSRIGDIVGRMGAGAGHDEGKRKEGSREILLMGEVDNKVGELRCEWAVTEGRVL
jgi:hypothetical protein